MHAARSNQHESLSNQHAILSNKHDTHEWLLKLLFSSSQNFDKYHCFITSVALSWCRLKLSKIAIPSVAPTYEDFKTWSSMACLVSPLGVVQSIGHITKTVAYDKRCCNNLLSVRKTFHNTTEPLCSKYIDRMWCSISSRLHFVRNKTSIWSMTYHSFLGC